MNLRRARFIVAFILVLTSFIGMTASTNLFTPLNPLLPQVNATLTIVVTLSPGTGQPGTHVLVNSTTTIPATDTACSLFSPSNDANGHNPIFPGSDACVINTGHIIEASFTIGNVLPGQYVIEVTACPGNTGCTPSQTPPGDYGQAILNVVSGPLIKLSPATGAPGTHVLVNGTGFLPTDTFCGVGAPGSNVVEPGTQACVIRAGSGVVNASFTINNVPPGQYVIQIVGGPGNDVAQAILNVISGPIIKLSPATGAPGTHVIVNGTGFLPTDTTCALGAPGSNAILPGTQACVIHQGSGVVNASFSIGNVTPGQYVIMVTGFPGDDSAQALLNVVSGPTIKLSPGTGQPGTHVAVNGTGFQPADTSCSISSITLDQNGHSPIDPGTAGCVIHPGNGIVNASFTIGNVLPGQYDIEVTGCGGNNGCSPSVGDFAIAILNVVSGPAIKLSPASGRTGAHILVNGTGFLPTDTFCGVGSPNSNVILPGSQACVIRAGSGIVNASFTIANVFPGQYVIQIVAGPGNDVAQAILNVVSGPSIALSPASGRTGAHILVNGSGFQPTDVLCTLVSPSSNLINPILPGTAACVIHEGTGLVNASFTIANVPPGQYVIEVDAYTAVVVTTTVGTTTTATSTTTTSTTATSTVSQEFAQAILNVVGGPAIFLSPATGPPGTHVLVNGTGFLPTDTFCGLGAPGSNVILPGSQACVIRSGSGLVNASFTINNVPPGQYVIQVVGSGGDSAQAILNVISGPQIHLSPATGQPGTHVLVNGTGFLPTDTTCALGAPGSNVIEPGTQACVIRVGSGIVNASFTINNVPPGQYVIQITAYPGGDSAQAILNVVSGPTIKLSPATGQPGTHVLVNGTGFLPTDTTCALGAPGSNAIEPGTQSCVIHQGSGVVNASFTINTVSPGQYVIQITAYPGGDSAQAILNVVSGPAIKLSPATGQPGTHVLVNGTGFLPTDTQCSLGAPGSNAILPGTQACVIHQGSGIVNASFTIGNVLPGQYIIMVTAYPGGDSAQAILNVVSGPAIKLSPATGQPGTHVLVNGTGFLPTDQSCTISSISLDVNGHGPIAPGTAGCVIRVGSGVVNASFTIGNILPGQYVIEVTGCGGNNGCTPSVGDFATAILNVVSGPRIKLSPATGQPGAHILVNGTGFLPTDTSCALGAPGSGAILAGTQACVIGVGSGVVNASFTIGSVLPGQYIIQVTGYPAGDFAQAILNVVSGPSIKLSPATGSPGTHISVNGTGFLPTDTFCALSAPGSGAVLPGTQACVTHVGSGVVNASFTIGNVLPGQYVIQITGYQGGDSAQAILNVVGGPRITLSPATGMIGQEVNVNGTGFLPTDQSCSISGSTPNLLNPVLPGSAGCAIAVGTGVVNGSFIIGNVPPGEYTIEVTGCGGNNGCAPSVGDFAIRVLRVVSSAATLTLSATNSTEESTIAFIGSGLSPSDTGCTLLAYNHKFVNGLDPGILDSNLITSPTCSIVSPGVAQGTFIVSPYATTDIAWNLTVRGTPAQDLTPFAVFNVTADVVVTPTSGTIHTVFTFTGSGFSSEATKCAATIVPPFPLGSAPGCYISGTSGQVSGSVVVPLNTVPGTYGIDVGDNDGHNATGFFTVGTPSALVVLNPSTVEQGQPVGVAGFGFNPNDTYCAISANAGPALFATLPNPPTCLISGGYASGAFLVSNTASGGYYLITVTACRTDPKLNLVLGIPTCPALNGLDFASNFLGVTLATTVTTGTITTTTNTVTAFTAVTTTSQATSFTFYSTTYSTTGILFTTYTHFTVNTVSGMTTTIITQTSSSTQTQTTVTYSTTTQFTTVPCGPLPCGFSTQPTPFNPAPGIDSAGLLAALLLLIPMLLRRLFT